MKLSLETHSASSAIDDTLATVERMTFFSSRDDMEVPVLALLWRNCRYDLSVCAPRWRTLGKQGLGNMAEALTQLIESCERYGYDRAADEVRELRDEFSNFSRQWYSFRWQ